MTGKYDKQQREVQAIVVKGDRPNLFGRDWLDMFKLDWHKLLGHSCNVTNMSSTNMITLQNEVQMLLDRYSDVFSVELGKYTGPPAHISIESGVRPIFRKARQVPLALKEKIEKTLETMVKEGTLEPVQYSQWATPTVNILKGNGEVRICGDYKITVNKVAHTDLYPIPRIDDLLAQLAGSAVYVRLDMRRAYEQLTITEEAQECLTINTHKGLFRPTRLPAGISSGPGLFQRVIDNLFRDIPEVIVYLDDILIGAECEKKALVALERVLTRLRECGFRLKKEKCLFLETSVEYLGFKIDREGIHPILPKVEAIHAAPEPKNKAQLQSFLGLINYYGRFCKQLSSKLTHLYNLLNSNVKWAWGSKERSAFEEAKKSLCSDAVLVHYSPLLDMSLSVDASSYGLGAVISHTMEDGSERPIHFASRTLNSAERNYSQTDKEAAAVMFGLTKFYTYLVGRKFTIYTDHKPLP